jgi:3-methyladenine DNA glycosylase AlkD
MPTPTHASLIGELQAMLDAVAAPTTKAWWEKYMRYTISFRGVGIPEIRKQLAQWRGMFGIDTWDILDQLSIALQCFDSSVAEDKLAGILFLQEYLYNQLEWQPALEQYADLFARDLIFDWNTCDWFCVRVLGPTIAHNGTPCAEAIAAWHQAGNLWQARSSVVAFVPIAAEEHYDPLIYASCRTLIQREERFAKTAVGWILRDLSRHAPADVRAFVEDQLHHFSPESLRNALKYFAEEERKAYVGQLKSGARISPKGVRNDA